MSKKFSVSSTPKAAATPAYDAGDPSVKAKGFQLTETASEGVNIHEPNRKYSFSNVSNVSAKSFLHPPDRLIVGRVIFKAKYIGYLMVKEPKGEPIVKEAVDKIKVAFDVRKINDKDFVDPEVELCISIRALKTVDSKTKDTLVQHSLPLVSFSADVKRGKQEIFSYIAKTSPRAKEYVCYAYVVPKGQGKQISATVSQAFELAYRKYQESKEIQEQFQQLKQKLAAAGSPEEKERIQKEMAAFEAKKMAEEERLQRARDQIHSEAEARGRVPVKVAPKAPPPSKAAIIPDPTPVVDKQPTEPIKEEVPPPTDDGSGGSSNGEGEEVEPVPIEVQAAPAAPPVWKRGFDVALNTLEQQIKDLEEAFEWRKEMERKQKSLLGKDASDQYLASLEDQLAKMPGNK